ncbi:MAG: hypothetical protein MJ180_03055 [Candidatus Gastranaerophilales bacterium]|nr:hypothetical protein [Candidatus Gastranaerophilales bacterium]
MKKLILSIIFVFCMALPTFAVDFMPKYSDQIKDYGIGLYFGDGQITVYEEPNDKSNVVADVKWDADRVYIEDKTYDPRYVFGVFLPKSALAGFIALDEGDGEYTKIIYDNSRGLSGWIKNGENNKPYYWRQLFYKFGKTKGIYLFANIPKDSKILKLSPDDEADTSYTFVYPKFIKLQLIKGNWALVKVLDYDNEEKVGWYKWRNPDGTLNLFPNFRG